ncbi:MAG TPA: hypothetical protein DEA90_04085 [Opitutae bacterium]|nr:hypothetical protein [Puniceicoccaceae bacterium]HBR93325.1 hypothetical protein [Opitutae bacterium]|tara:strand:- start:3306 stop:4118 length:813 start_codon:yes stop_codon:yes gene_type:complete
MKSLHLATFTLAPFVLTISAQAQVFLVDFNNTADGNGYPGGGSTWNAYATPSEVNGSVIQATNGSTASGITLDYTDGTMRDSSNGNSNTFDNTDGGPAWVTTDGSFGNTAAAADYFFTDNGSDADFTVTFGNLAVGEEVNLDLWMSRVGSTSSYGHYTYSLDGGVNWNGFTVLEKDGSASTDTRWLASDTQATTFRAETDGNDNARYMNISGIIIGAVGTLDVKVDDTSSSNWTGLAAMRLTVIPEPASFAMLLGGLALASRVLRRRAHA